MCQYRYFFYPSCRHQQTVLVRYCEHATSVPVSGDIPRNVSTTQHFGEQLRMLDEAELNWKGAKRALNHPGKKEERRKKEEVKKKKNKKGQKKSHLPSAAGDHKSSSALDVTRTQTASLPSITHQNSTETSSSIVPQCEQTPDMAALRPFGFQTFFGGTTNKQPAFPEDDDPAHPRVAIETHARHREPGIRQNTDESWDLPNSSDLLQHLADSPIGLGIRDHTNRRSAHIAQDSTYEMSEDDSLIRESFDQIEQEVDALKREVLRLKHNSASTQHHHERQVKDVAEPQSSPVEHEALSPAENLIRQHEQWAASPSQQPPKPRSPPAPPGPAEFPALDIGVKAAVAKPGKAAGASLRSGTASAATPHCMNKKANTGTRNKRADSKIPAPVSPRRAGKREVEDDTSVIINPAVPSAPNGQMLKEGPHFAQPTKSFARRAGETLRKESAASASKQSHEMSPTKSTKARSPALETDKRASTRHNKRQSLPSNWTGGTPTQQEDYDVRAPVSTSMPSGTSSQGQQMASGDKESRPPIANKVATQPETPPQVRKKPSSYMSPTAATTQRVIATLGEDTAMGSDLKTKPWVADAVANKLQSSMPAADVVMIPGSPESCASAHFENLIASLGAPPALAPRKPSYAEVSSRGANQPHTATKIHRQSGPTRGNAGPISTVQATHSKASRQAAALNSPSDLLIRYAGEARLPKPLTSVANTTAKRRTSHADILKPIFDKLNQHGLQRGRSDPTNLSVPVANDHDAANDSARQTSSDFDASKATTAWQAKGPLVDVARLARQGAKSKTTTLPPHMSATQAKKSEPQPDYSASVGPTEKPESDSRSSSMPPAPRAVSSSLRPTAQSFEPLWKPDTAAKELSWLSWQGAFDYYSDEEWAGFSEDARRSIICLRNMKRGDSRSLSPSKRSQQRFWGELMNKTASQTSSAKSAMPEAVDAREHAMPTTFGRAPMPNLPAMQASGLVNNTTPISPASDDTSPIKTPPNIHAWTIGSNFHPQKHPYGWKGGDGREISFSGYGPQAEIDPRNPVNMLFFPRSDSVATPEKKYSPTPRVWPKSQKQWAEFAGYQQQLPQKMQMQPCGDMEFVSATEHMPGSSAGFGYCNNCVQ